MLRILVPFLMAIGLVVPAAATPPDVANVRDELFGINETHVFVLRTTDDNLGSYYESRSEVFLVAIDLVSADEEYWPLYGVTQTTDFGDNGAGDEPVITPDNSAEAINPFAILAKRMAVPLGDFGPLWNAPTIDNSSAALTIRYKDSDTYLLSASDQSARLTASIKAITANITNHPRMASIDTKQIFAQLDMGLEYCRFTDPVRRYSRSSNTPFQLIRMTCGDEDEGMGGTSLIVPVPIAATHSTLGL